MEMTVSTILKAAFRIQTFHGGILSEELRWRLADMVDSLEWALASQTHYEYVIGIPARIVAR
jgi:hypothetical protein